MVRIAFERTPHASCGLRKEGCYVPQYVEATQCLAGVLAMQVNGKDAQQLKEDLAHKHGIMVRHYQKKLLDGFVRISVGKPEQTDFLITALRSMVKS